MNVIAACVLGGVSINGGTGRVQGVLLGAVLLGILNNAMPLIHVSSFWQDYTSFNYSKFVNSKKR